MVAIEDSSPTTSFAALLALICAAQFVLQLDFSIVNVALPSIQRSLGMSAAQLQWIVTGYALTFGSLLLIGGRAADRFGRRRVLMAGLVGFALASLAAGVAQSPLELVVARLIQGVSGAMVSPAALSLLTTTSPEGPSRTRALGLWQAATAAGATAGILIGGLLTQFLGWRAIFLVNPPLICVLLVLVPRLLPAGDRSASGRIKVPEGLLGTATLAALIFGLTNGEQHGFAQPATIVALLIAVLLAVIFVAAERHVATPLIPRVVLSDPGHRAAVAMMVLAGGIVASYVYFVSLYLQRVHHFTPVSTGLALVPATVTVVLTSTFGTRRLAKRTSPKTRMLLGLAAIACGQAWLGHIAGGTSYFAAVLPGQLLTASGVGIAFPTASAVITSGVRGPDQGAAGASFVTSQQTGAAAGLATLATIAAARTAASPSHSLVAGYRLAFLISAGIAGFTAVLIASRLRPVSRAEPLAPESS